MLKIENTEIIGWEAAIRGMRNPMNSWEKSDSAYCRRDLVRDCTRCVNRFTKKCSACKAGGFDIGPKDHDLMMCLRNSGTDHRKFMRMITVYLDITAPLYWWKEFDTYKVGTVANSCSTMHKIADKEFTLDDFSCEHLIDYDLYSCNEADGPVINGAPHIGCGGLQLLNITINVLNYYRDKYLSAKDKKYWWQMIQLLPSSYNQKRTVMLNYEVLANIYKSRKDHKLDEWRVHDTPDEHAFRNKDFASGMWGFCDWIESLPYSELITGEENNNDK